MDLTNPNPLKKYHDRNFVDDFLEKERREFLAGFCTKESYNKELNAGSNLFSQ